MHFECNRLKEPQLLESLGWFIYYLGAISLGKDTGAVLEKRQHLTGCGVDCHSNRKIELGGNLSDLSGPWERGMSQIS